MWSGSVIPFPTTKIPCSYCAYGIQEQASVDRRGAVRYSEFANIKIDIPPPCEQRRIAEILDSIDDQIAATADTVVKLDLVGDGLLADAFA